MLLYKLCFSSGKNYIGQTQRTMKVRMLQHERSVNGGSQLAVHCAWRKHGKPVVELIGEFDCAADLHAAEIAAIASHGTLSPFGYNIGYGGETAPSKNPEVAAKIAAKARGRKCMTPEHKANSAKAMRERMADPEYVENVLKAQEAYWTPERRAEQAEIARARSTGVKFTDERRANIAKSKQNLSAETRAKMSASAKQRKRLPFSDEHCANISQSVAKSWADETIRSKRSAAIKVATNDPLSAQARRERAAKTWENPETRERRIAAIRAAKSRKRQNQ